MKRVSTALRSLPLRLAARRWPPRSRLVLVGDGSGWVLTEEMKALEQMASQIRVRSVTCRRYRWFPRQAAFFASSGQLLRERAWECGIRVGASYYHGRPGTGSPNFDARFQQLCDHAAEIDALHVTNRPFRDVILTSGIDPDRVFLIPIGVDLSLFPRQTEESRHAARSRLELPREAYVIGSFQKDGAGWGEGEEPKPEKGPDLLCDAIDLARKDIPDLHVLLSGPTRGYVKRRLEKMGVPFVHTQVERYEEMGTLYQAIDLYHVSSREEGGPKAVLESMASGVPLVTTRVGQAVEMVDHGKNAWMVDVGDVEGAAQWITHAHALARAGSEELTRVLDAARGTAEANSLEKVAPLWRPLLARLIDGLESAGE